MIVKGKKKRIWINLKEFNKTRKKKLNIEQFDIFNRAHAGETYLATERGGRNSTGAFYTPDNIVSIIIRNILKPIVQEKQKEAKDKNQKLVDVTF